MLAVFDSPLQLRKASRGPVSYTGAMTSQFCMTMYLWTTSIRTSRGIPPPEENVLTPSVKVKDSSAIAKSSSTIAMHLLETKSSDAPVNLRVQNSSASRSNVTT